MGSSLSWVAVNNFTPEELERLLGFKRTGKSGNYGEEMLVGRRLASGWYILIAKGCDDPIIQNKTLLQLSERAQVVACSIEEHVMFSSCVFWEQRKKIWSVKHRGEENVFDVVKSGKLPTEFSSLKDELIAKQKSADGDNAGVDYLFELPLQLAQQIVGFKHDEKGEVGDYEIFELSQKQKLTRTVKTWVSWLQVIGIFIGIIVVLAACGMVVRSLLNWLIKLVY